MTTYNGKCHCGQTEWTVKLEKEQQNHVICHCDTCKQLGGGAFTLNQVVPAAAIKLTKGDTKTYTYTGDSGKPVHCYYCPNCTTHVYHHQIVAGDNVVVKTVHLEGGKGFEVSAEIYGKAKMGWEREVATTFAVLPPGH